MPQNRFIIAAAFVLIACGCSRRSTNTPRETAPQPEPAAVLVPITNMIPVHAGSFMRAKHRVTLTRDYWLGKFEVTQGEYLELTGKNPSHFPGDSNRPVEKVTWNDAAAYCAKLTAREREAGRLPRDYEYRLPTEAEWEYACRAGTTNLFSFGDDESKADQFAWTSENASEGPHPVGQKLPNPWGFYDIHGNVWEWCLDWFQPFPPVDAIDPSGPPSGKFKVFRGGGWNNEAPYARSANRFMMQPDRGIHFVGFRVALCSTAAAR